MADLLREALPVRADLQRPVVTADSVRASSKRHSAIVLGHTGRDQRNAAILDGALVGSSWRRKGA